MVQTGREIEREPAAFAAIAAAAVDDESATVLVAAPGAGKKLSIMSLILEADQKYTVEDTFGTAFVGVGLAVSGIVDITGLSNALASGNNGPGTGTLEWDPISGLRWTAPGGTAGAYVEIPGDGSYTMLDGTDPNSFLTVTVTFASLPVAAESDSVVLAGLAATAPMPAGRLNLDGGDSPWSTLTENRGLRVTNRNGAAAAMAIAGGAVYKTLDV